MHLPDARAPRLFVETPLAGGTEVTLERDQTHYLVNVMRRGIGDAAVLFNGRDGEWAAVIATLGRRSARLLVTEQLRPQAAPQDIRYCFAPLKRARLDFIAQKATELGAAALQPVVTRHTVAARVNVERLRANAIEAAEQCGVLWVPEIAEPLPLDRFLAGRERQRVLVFCDESAPLTSPIEALSKIETTCIDVLIGPEGGFAEEERQAIREAGHAVALSLGPRIMRSDTAGIAALALIQAVLGDWH